MAAIYKSHTDLCLSFAPRHTQGGRSWQEEVERAVPLAAPSMIAKLMDFCLLFHLESRTAGITKKENKRK